MEFVDKWLTITGSRSETPRFLSKTGKSYVNRMSTKKSTCFHEKNVNKHVDNVDNYCPSRDSPIFTTSPAPIVINKSPGWQC